MPDEGVTAWDDLILDRVEYKNESLEDVVILRSDGRPTYNFASPIEDWLDAITHVIRGNDHVSNTPKQVLILGALGAPIPEYGHLPFVHGPGGAKLSKRHGSVTVDEFRAQGYVPDALVNYLALLGWSYDDKTTIMSRDELIERFSLERVGKSAGVFDYAKLDWLNGEYLRAMSPGGRTPTRSSRICASRGTTGTRTGSAGRCRSCRRRSSGSGSSRSTPASCSGRLPRPSRRRWTARRR